MNAIGRPLLNFHGKHIDVCSRGKRGITKIEVIAVVGVLFLLLQLLLPALILEREAARRQACLRNLQRIGQSLHAYHDAHQRLPPAARWSSAGLDLERFPRVSPTVQVTYSNWVQLLLPYLEEQNLFEQFDFEVPMVHPHNKNGRQTALPALRCPSDSYNTESNLYVYTGEDGSRASFARGNYSINGGPQHFRDSPGTIMTPRPLGTQSFVDQQSGEIQWWGDGVAGINKSFSFHEFANGLSTTVLVNEVRAGIHEIDPRGVWALGQIGGSVTWAHGRDGDAVGPNPTNHDADDILRGDELHRLLGKERIEADRMTCCDHCDKNDQAGSRSMHPNGVNTLFGDGSVRFIPDNIDDGAWQELHCRVTPSDVLKGVFDELPLDGNQSELVPFVEASNSIKLKKNNTALRIVNSVAMRFQRIPAGKFTMGLHDEGNTLAIPTETPAHEVVFEAPFYMAIYEVTHEQFETVMGDNPSLAANNESENNTTDVNPTSRAVENVSWQEAEAFCNRLSELDAERKLGRSYRLPTEAEWEYCCRSGSLTPTRYEKEWRDDDTSGEIAQKRWREDQPPVMPVGSYPPNEFGLYDMRGNVWEWCSDWFQRDYYSWSRKISPRGPATGYLKVYRGSDWVLCGYNCKTGSRSAPPWVRSSYIGFRVVCEQRAELEVAQVSYPAETSP